MSSNDRQAYVQAVLNLYRRLPCAATRPRPADRRLAAELERRGVSLDVIEIALRLAAARRLARPPDAEPLAPVRSLHYFLPVIEDLPAGPPPEGYLEYLRERVPDREPATDLIPPESEPASLSRRSRRHPRQPRLPLDAGALHENDVF